jgi:hypothetical protein
VFEFHLKSRIYATILFIGSGCREGRSLVGVLSNVLNRIRSPVNGWLSRTRLYGSLRTKGRKSKNKKNKKEEEEEKEEEGKEDNDNKTTKKESKKNM